MCGMVGNGVRAKTSGRFMRVGRSRVLLLSSRSTHAKGAADQVTAMFICRCVAGGCCGGVAIAASQCDK